MASIELRGGKWRARVRRRGHPEQSETFRTKAAAERWARKAEADQDEGHQAPAAEAKRMSLADALDKYLKEVSAEKRGAAQEAYRIALWKKQTIAERPLVSITPSDVAAFRKARKAAGKSSNTIRLELMLLSNLFTVARTEWKMARLPNPVADTKKPSTVGTERSRRLRPGEEPKLLKACRATGPAWLPHLVVFAIETAMRRGEIVAMRDAWVADSIVEIPMTKNGEPRRVPLSPRAQTALGRLRKALGGSLDAMPSKFTVSIYFKRAADRAGLVDLHFHDLRREGTSRLFERGFGIQEAATVTGHKTWSMLRRYTAPQAEDLVRKLAEKKPTTQSAAG
jgi:integrase